jgi:hypothetical protein
LRGRFILDFPCLFIILGCPSPSRRARGEKLFAGDADSAPRRSRRS